MSPDIVREFHVEKHFDALALSYDELKTKKNTFYYQTLIKVISGVIPVGAKVLDIGTGTGEILNQLLPVYGVGIDLSPAMIEIARKKFSHLSFFSGSYKTLDLGKSFDYVLLADVIEHLESPESLFGCLKEFCNPNTQIVLTMANPAWEPLLQLLEKLKLKMEEGPHWRISEKELLLYAKEGDFELVSEDSFVLLPLYIPLLSIFINDFIARLPWVRKITLIQRYVFKLSS